MENLGRLEPKSLHRSYGRTVLASLASAGFLLRSFTGTHAKPVVHYTPDCGATRLPFVSSILNSACFCHFWDQRKSGQGNYKVSIYRQVIWSYPLIPPSRKPKAFRHLHSDRNTVIDSRFDSKRGGEKCLPCGRGHWVLGQAADCPLLPILLEVSFMPSLAWV